MYVLEYNSLIEKYVIWIVVLGEVLLLLVGLVYFVIWKVILIVWIEIVKWIVNLIFFDKEGFNDFYFDFFVLMDRIKKFCGLDNVELYLVFMVINV